MSTKPKHTPGPWRLHDTERATVVAGRPGIPICVCDARSRTESENDSNAKLIRGLPQLLQSMQAIRARINGDWDHPALVAMEALNIDTEYDVLQFAEMALFPLEDEGVI